MTDLVVVGAGIAGLAHAVEAVRRGWSVVVLERGARADGASVRNFGMVWPLGQRAGLDRERALRSRGVWLELAAKAGFWCRESGAVVAARTAEELAVIGEFSARSGAELGCEVLSSAAARERCPALRAEGLLGALWSPNELAIDPREAVARLTEWLSRQPGVEVRFGETVAEIGRGMAVTEAGGRFPARRFVVCSGVDTARLFPEIYAGQPLAVCTLQMMRTRPQPRGWRLGPHIASGLALRHYPAFDDCPSIGALRRRVATEHPELDAYGIHVLVAQNHLGELVLGDSHRYGDLGGQDYLPRIDELVMDCARELLGAPDLDPAARWTGTYLKRTDGGSLLTTEAEPGVRVVNALGGAGMTLSFAIAEEILAAW